MCAERTKAYSSKRKEEGDPEVTLKIQLNEKEQ